MHTHRVISFYHMRERERERGALGGGGGGVGVGLDIHDVINVLITNVEGKEQI